MRSFNVMRLEKNTCNLNSKLMEVSSTYLQFQNPQKITISSSKHGCVFKIIGFYEKRTTKVKEKNNRPLSSNTSSTTKSRTGVSGFSFRRWCIFTQIAVPQKTSAIFLPHHDQKCRENRSLNRVVKGPLGAYNVA